MDFLLNVSDDEVSVMLPQLCLHLTWLLDVATQYPVALWSFERKLQICHVRLGTKSLKYFHQITRVTATR